MAALFIRTRVRWSWNVYRRSRRTRLKLAPQRRDAAGDLIEREILTRTLVNDVGGLVEGWVREAMVEVVEVDPELRTRGRG